MGEPMETTVATTWHDPGRGWITVPAGTPCRQVGLEEMPEREQWAFNRIRRRDAKQVLIFLARKFRALPISKLRKRRAGGRIMIDPTEREQAALRAAGPLAGDYIEKLGKTDLARFTVEEFTTLIQVIVSAYLEAKATFNLNNTWDDVPF